MLERKNELYKGGRKNGMRKEEGTNRSELERRKLREGVRGKETTGIRVWNGGFRGRENEVDCARLGEKKNKDRRK